MNDFLSNISSCEWIALSSTLAIGISQGLTCDEIATLASFFSSLGDNLGIIASSGNCNPTITPPS